ncbi:MAG: hypothetical protein GF344_15355 [Chitinivibrionales bacterium]|nr:hypothetical protein [Chitinivibrionales bacterium]MBD3358083.1 hypothetical protein [Chitinivibrionales bacterium]
MVDLSKTIPSVSAFALGPVVPMTEARYGELLFHHASICFQNRQSCHFCSPFGRSNAPTWDLENDGRGNPMDVKTLLIANYTPPAMPHDIRQDYSVAVHVGFQFILFVDTEEEKAEAVECYIEGMRPAESPHLVNGEPSGAALRGKELFFRTIFRATNVIRSPFLYRPGRSRCSVRESYDLGSRFDTPALIECRRTVPYLYSGKYTTLRELFAEGKHGVISRLTDQEIDDLCPFLLPLEAIHLLLPPLLPEKELFSPSTYTPCRRRKAKGYMQHLRRNDIICNNSLGSIL